MNCPSPIILESVFLFALCIANFHPASIRRVAQDGPVSVNLGDVYRKGEIKIDPYDLNTMPRLPAGYVPLNDKGYLITTTAAASMNCHSWFFAIDLNEKRLFATN